MKQLFLFLVFVNLVYFFWGMTNTDEQSNTIKKMQLYDVKTIEVLKKIPSETLVKQQAFRQPKADKCFVVGDFASEKAATELESQLVGLQNQVMVAHSEPSDEFWVIFPAGETWEESQKNVEILKNKGVTDLWLIPNGEGKGIISLGLFLTIERANTQVEALNKKQVDVDVITRNKFRYQVQVRTNKNASKIQTILNTINEEIAIVDRCTF